MAQDCSDKALSLESFVAAAESAAPAARASALAAEAVALGTAVGAAPKSELGAVAGCQTWPEALDVLLPQEVVRYDQTSPQVLRGTREGVL